MSTARQPIEVDAPEVPTAPGEAEWRALSPSEREAFLDDSLAALQREAELMAEGNPHIRAKFRIRIMLEDFFSRIGRRIYLGTELPVHYPGERVFAPDFLAVLDVEDPGHDDQRMAWVVVDEGRGLDLVIEILHRGDPHKDLVHNVLTYARMGIPEYFVYDRRKDRISGFRLPASGAARYEPIPSHGGTLSSRVLGLDLAISGGRLHFYYGGARVPETRELLARAQRLLDEVQDRVEEETRRAEEQHRRAEEELAARVRAEQRADAEAETRRALEQQIAELRAQLEK